jgi:FkbM family methyltransferase
MNKNFYTILTESGLKPKSILHIGANRGQEAKLYNSLGIEGWHVEAIPAVYEEFLVSACNHFHDQHAINACLADTDGCAVKFNLASNQGQSSSLLGLGRHAVAHPSVNYIGTIELKTKTVDTLILEATIPSSIQFLLVDAQGGEAMILDGAKSLLASGSLQACQIETAVVPLYDGGATFIDICNRLQKYGLYLRHCVFNQKGWTDALFMRAWWPQEIPLEADKSANTIEIIKPKPCPFPLIRVGGNKDGAYLLPDDLKGIKACFSPGVNNKKEFEDELLEKFEIVSHMCDFSSDVEKLKTPLKPGQTFKKKWLDVNGDKDSISLSDWVTDQEPDANDDLLMQMDIEGAEYRNILNTPENILQRFRIIVIELHGLDVVNQPEKYKNLLEPLLILLGKYFICVHAHPNNCCGDVMLSGSELNIPKVLELTFLRKDRWNRVRHNESHTPLLPHPLDIPYNVPRKPPLFLNEHWLESGKRAPESIIKMLTDQVNYLERELRLVKQVEY